MTLIYIMAAEYEMISPFVLRQEMRIDFWLKPLLITHLLKFWQFVKPAFLNLGFLLYFT